MNPREQHTCRRRIIWENVFPRGRSCFTTWVVILNGRLAMTCKTHPLSFPEFLRIIGRSKCMSIEVKLKSKNSGSPQKVI